MDASLIHGPLGGVLALLSGLLAAVGVYFGLRRLRVSSPPKPVLELTTDKCARCRRVRRRGEYGPKGTSWLFRSEVPEEDDLLGDEFDAASREVTCSPMKNRLEGYWLCPMCRDQYGDVFPHIGFYG